MDQPGWRKETQLARGEEAGSVREEDRVYLRGIAALSQAVPS